MIILILHIHVLHIKMSSYHYLKKALHVDTTGAGTAKIGTYTVFPTSTRCIGVVYFFKKRYLEYIIGVCAVYFLK